MTNYTHQTAPTSFVEASGIRFACHRFIKQGGVPLVFVQYFRRNPDHFDPTITDGLAPDRKIIIFANAGVGISSGDA